MMIIIIFPSFSGRCWLVKTKYILVRKFSMAKANASSKENENVFSVVAKRWPIQGSQIVELLIQEFTHLWILLIKIQFPCTNPRLFSKSSRSYYKVEMEISLKLMTSLKVVFLFLQKQFEPCHTIFFSLKLTNIQLTLEMLSITIYFIFWKFQY